MSELTPLFAVPPELRHRTAVRAGEGSLDRATLAARVETLAGELGAAPASSVIGIHIGNQAAFVVALLACLRSRRTAVMLDPHWTPAELEQAAKRIDISVLLQTSASPQSSFGAFELDPLGRVLSRPAQVGPSERFDLSDVAVIHWSSGSTGRPKPIAVSRAALEYRFTSLIDSFSLGADDRVLCFVPLSHCHGSDCIALPTLAAGAELVLMEPLEALPERVVSSIEQHRITVFSALPRFYDQLLQQAPDPDRLRTVRAPLCGSAALDPRIARRFADRFGTRIRTGYGLTEVGLLCLNRHEHDPVRFDSVGPVLPDVEWRIVDPDAGGVGELWVRSPGCADAYLGEQAEQASRFQDGWLRTQDLVRADDDGYLYVVGRSSTFINCNGAKVDPREIERVIEMQPWVAECAVLGIADEIGIERIAAFVVVRPGQAGAEPEAELRRCVADSLSAFKVPSLVGVVDTLPRSTLGKILYSELRAAYAARPARPSSSGAEAPANDAERAVAAIWCAVLGRGQVGVNDRFSDLGGHSLHLAQILKRLRERFGHDWSVADMFRFPTVRAQAEALSGNASSTVVDAAVEGARRQREAFERREEPRSPADRCARPEDPLHP